MRDDRATGLGPRSHTANEDVSVQAVGALARSLHGWGDMVEAIRDQWLIVLGVLVMTAAIVWLIVRR
jgi:hypothetical protein